MTSTFATVTQATAFHAVGRMHYTLGVLDSAVLSRTAFLSGAVMLSIQTVYALASGASAPLISIGLNVLVIGSGWLLLRASHLSMLYLDKDKELAGFAGPSGIDESNRRWFHSWADGDPDFSDMTLQVRKAERAIALSVTARVNRESELFSKGELIVSAPNSVVTGPERTDKDNADRIMSPKSTYSFPQHSKLYEMNVIRMPMATPAALSLRLKAPRPVSSSDSPVAAEAEGAVGAVDSAAKEAVWCVADAGGTMVAALPLFVDLLASATNVTSQTRAISIPHNSLRPLSAQFPEFEDRLRLQPIETLAALALAFSDALIAEFGDAVARTKRLVRITSYDQVTPLKDLKANLMGRFISVRGTIVRVSSIKPVVTQISFICSTCSQTQVLEQFDGKYRAPMKCVGGDASCRGKTFLPDRSGLSETKTVDWQRIRIQEKLPDDQKDSGRIPRTVECEMTDEL
ncbi:DNA replication licensing factor mcm8, partial [Chytriomyces hyalinus]